MGLLLPLFAGQRVRVLRNDRYNIEQGTVVNVLNMDHCSRYIWTDGPPEATYEKMCWGRRELEVVDEV